MRRLNIQSIVIGNTSTVLTCILSVLMYTFVSLLCRPHAFAQNSEFKMHENGLIYDEQTMAKLEYIVDSLNLKFKTCEPKEYRSLPQGYATFVFLNENTSEAEVAMGSDMPLESFLKEFAPARHVRQWIVKSYSTNYRQEKVVEYSTLPLRNDDRLRIQLPQRPANDKSSGWIFEKKDGELLGFYLEDVRPVIVPFRYAQLIQYVDCLIDTTAQIYSSDARTREFRELPPDSKINQYLKMTEDYKGEPRMPKINWDSPSAQKQYDNFIREYEQWVKRRLTWLDEKMKDNSYISLLMEAADESIERKMGDPRLEFYVERYLSSDNALAMKRLRRPVGSCSMDQTPRLHAQSICRLAAKTTQWDIFLRAHLDIMNDNFERRSDGSYAWDRRGTYLRELEELDINTLDLLIGTSLRAIDLNDNHYYGDIARVGRALSEATEKDELERRVLYMIKDENLDLFNRLLMAFLFDNYNHYLDDDIRKKNNNTQFISAVATLPNRIGESFIR